MGRARTQLACAGPAADPFTCTACGGRGWTGYDAGGSVLGCSACDGLGRRRLSGESSHDSPEPDPAPGGLLDAPACAYLVATQGADVVDVGLTVGELVDRLTADWECLVGDIVLWEVGAEPCPAPRARVILYGTPGGVRTLWL